MADHAKVAGRPPHHDPLALVEPGSRGGPRQPERILVFHDHHVAEPLQKA